MSDRVTQSFISGDGTVWRRSSPEKREEVLAMVEEGVPPAEIASRAGVSYEEVQDVIRGGLVGYSGWRNAEDLGDE